MGHRTGEATVTLIAGDVVVATSERIGGAVMVEAGSRLPRGQLVTVGAGAGEGSPVGVGVTGCATAIEPRPAAGSGAALGERRDR